MKDLLGSEDVEQGIENNRKLLARVLIKGEANITSASISKDGSVLAVATASAIKLFQLMPIENAKEELKIRQIEVPVSIGKDGSTLVQISPDGQWLSWVQDGIKVLTTRIIRDDSSSDSQIAISPRPAKLTRLRRDIPKQVRLGGLGSYDRRITHVAFSPRSNILATADLAGYVDTWVLRDGSLQNGAHNHEDEDASSSASSDAESDNENDQESGPRWIRNPKAALFPKLSHSPVVLSFSEDALGPSLRGEGGATDEPVLLAVTTASRIYTFHPLEGALTRWSRRNGVWKLPDEIRATRDLIKGAVWQGPRIWMYGASFLFMLDISQDYAEEEAAANESTKQKRSRKRKRGMDTGAGSKMESSEALAPQHVRVALAEDGKVGEWVDVQMEDADQAGSQADDDDDESGDEGGELQKLRDREYSAQKNDGAEAAGEDGSSSNGSQRRNWWHTYKYRPILGVVPLSTTTEDVQQANGVVNGKAKGTSSKKMATLEVALVERPKWDMDMPARYVED